MIKISILIEHLFGPMLNKCNTYSVKAKVLSSIIYFDLSTYFYFGSTKCPKKRKYDDIVNRLCIAGCIRTQFKIIIG
jgi:hypothetical protein